MNPQLFRDSPLYADVSEYYAGLIQFRKAHPALRMTSAEEVAAAALFLASDGASYITGTVLGVDGGWN